MEDKFPILDEGYSFIPQELFYSTWKNYHQDFHSHRPGCLEIDYIAEGACTYVLNNHTVQLSRRSLLIHNGNIPHSYHVSDSCLNLSILCYQEPVTPNAGTIAELLNGFSETAAFFKKLNQGIIIKNAGNLNTLSTEIYDCFNTAYNPMYLNLLTNKFLIDCFDACKLKTSADIYVEKAKNLIRYNYFSIKNIEEISKELSLHKVYLQRIFKEKTHVSIWNYLNEIRMEKAAYYLTQTQVPIGEIDELVGIHSRQNFYLLFKNKYGMAPSDYRKAKKEFEARLEKIEGDV